MALIRKTVVDQISIDDKGVFQIRANKQIVEDSTGAVLASNYARTIFEPGADFEGHMATFNEAIVQGGEEPITAGDLARIERLVEIEHTPEVIAAYAASNS